MGFLRPPKYRKSASEEALEKQMEEERKAAEEEKKRLEAEEKRNKQRFAAGKLGSRSLFARAGGRGFYTEGEET